MNTSDLHTNTHTHTHAKTYVTTHINTHKHPHITYTHICGGVGAYIFKALDLLILTIENAAPNPSSVLIVLDRHSAQWYLIHSTQKAW